MTSIFSTINDNAITTTARLLQLLKVPVTNTTLRQSLREHPDYPSLLSVSDTLSDWKVKSLGVQLDLERLKELPVPFVAHIKEGKQDMFTVVRAVDDNSISFYKEAENQFITTSLKDFSDVYQGAVLLAEAIEGAGEPQYRHKYWQEILNRLKVPVILLVAIVLLGLIVGNKLSIGSGHILFQAGFGLLSLAGVVITGLLLWYEVDRQNPVLHKICTAGKNTNCGKVLQSNAAKLGGLISWSEIGFIYFTGGFLSLLLSGQNPAIMTILAWLNILAIPYVFFSLYYQWRVAKQWCVLCLTVQGLLLAELAVNLTGTLYEPAALTGFSLLLIIILIFSFLTPWIVWSALKPLWIKAEQGKRDKTALLRMKHNARIFEALLSKQKTIAADEIQHLGITLGNPNAKYQLIKVCNPYCGPCARAHPKMEDILENNPEVSARIIFTATDDERDRRSWPAKHLMAISAKGDQELIKQALDDWYHAELKDYDIFKEKYPLNGELKLQGEKLRVMSEWCEKTGISFTPTFFVQTSGKNVGFQLPEMYGIEDLKYLIG